MIREIRQIIILPIFFSLYFLGISKASEISLTSEISKTKVELGEKFTFTITVSGNYKITPKIKLPDLSEFSIISTRQSSTYNIKAKRYEAVTKYEFILLPKKVGIFFIGPVELKYNNSVYKTQALQTEVLPAPNTLPDKDREIPWKKKRGVIL